MAQSHLIALPSQELSALRCAATAPQYAQLFEQLPAFRAALLAPVDDELRSLASAASSAISACANTNYPEGWDDDRACADRLAKQKRAQEASQASAPARPAPKPHGNTQCPCCGGRRIVGVFAHARDCNYMWIPHLDFEKDGGYMPSKFGIPGSSDGPSIEVCLDCGRVVNGEYPLPEDVLAQRVAKYNEERL